MVERTGHILFVTWPGGGNVPPLVALGVQLTERGHRVRVLAAEPLRGRFESEGLSFRAHRTAAEWTNGNPIDWAKGPTSSQRLCYLRGLAKDVMDEIEREPVDLAIVDYMQPDALCAVERLQVPLVAFVHTLYARVATGTMSPMTVLSGGAEPVNALRGELELPALKQVPDLLDKADLTLVITLQSLDGVEQVPNNVRYVGPIVERPGPDAGWSPPWPKNERPVVHASTSTNATAEQAAKVLQAILDASAELDATVFVTATKEVRAKLTAPANAHVSGYVRHAAVLPHVDLLVTHAGLSSVGAALQYGTPMVCLPLLYEQPMNAARATAIGVASTVPSDAPIDVIRSAVSAALKDDARRKRAREIAASLAQARPHRAVTEIERLLAKSLRP